MFQESSCCKCTSRTMWQLCVDDTYTEREWCGRRVHRLTTVLVTVVGSSLTLPLECEHCLTLWNSPPSLQSTITNSHRHTTGQHPWLHLDCLHGFSTCTGLTRHCTITTAFFQSMLNCPITSYFTLTNSSHLLAHTVLCPWKNYYPRQCTIEMSNPNQIECAWLWLYLPHNCQIS